MNDYIKNIFRALQNYETPVAADGWEAISRQLSLNSSRQEAARLQAALHSYEYPVEANDWEIIHRRLQGRKKRKIIAIRLAAYAAAAAIAMFLWLRYPTAEEKPLHPTATPAVTANITPKPANEQIQVAAAAPITKPQAIATAHSTPYANKQQPTIAPSESITSSHSIDTIPSTATAATQAEKVEDATELVAKAAPPFPDSLPAFPLFDDPLPDKKKSSQKWAIALLAGQSASSNQSLGSSKAELDFSNSPSSGNFIIDSDLLPSSSTEEQLDKATGTRHYVPLSAGVTFRFYFTSRWAVESGLVYSYLASSHSFANQVEVKQRLHYLGILLNFAYQLTKRKRFSLYASGGCMVEKGLTASYSTGKNTEREAIDGIQLSLNGQLGVGYNFYNRFNLYIEPGVRYFFPNSGQPTSIRTDQPLNFNVNVGVRADF